MPAEEHIIPAQMRREYRKGELHPEDLHPDPVEQFNRWFEEARAAGVAEPNAMTLATADRGGAPSARVLLVKEFDARGFVFYTNYTSRKARELAENPRAAMVFWWPPLERQVRISGEIEKVTRAESEAYFHSRPISSQIGAWASHQSRPIASRDALEQREAELRKKFAGRPVPMPDFWGGYRLIPSTFELWQGRPSRLHDRLVYQRQPDGSWTIARLEP